MTTNLKATALVIQEIEDAIVNWHSESRYRCQYCGRRRSMVPMNLTCEYDPTARKNVWRVVGSQSNPDERWIEITDKFQRVVSSCAACFEKRWTGGAL